jgi:hypothetical protein
VCEFAPDTLGWSRQGALASILRRDFRVVKANKETLGDTINTKAILACTQRALVTRQRGAFRQECKLKVFSQRLLLIGRSDVTNDGAERTRKIYNLVMSQALKFSLIKLFVLLRLTTLRPQSEFMILINFYENRNKTKKREKNAETARARDNNGAIPGRRNLKITSSPSTLKSHRQTAARFTCSRCQRFGS